LVAESNGTFSDNSNPAEFEEQGPGAGFLDYLSQYGAQDAVVSFGVAQGRLYVIGKRTVQSWIVDADPINFNNVQVLDNIGTFAPLATQQLGDSDVLILHNTGVRSLKTREVTLNAIVDDIGSPIDKLIQAALSTLTAVQAATACGIVEPKTLNYWLFLKDTLYVLSRHPSANISAWSTYAMVGNDNVTFVPVKFVVYNGVVYSRSVARGHYVYGGTNNTTYDQYSQVTWTTPWLDDKSPGTNKSFTGLAAVMAGSWTLSIATDPPTGTYVPIMTKGTAAAPNVLTDSTYDQNRYPVDMIGTHFSLKGVSANISTSIPAIFGSLNLHYNRADTE
jgi:hypothetical protein